MRALVAFISFLLLATAAQPAAAQCTAPGCELATAVVAQARATGRAVLTAEAPPTSTPAPTATPWPTATPQPTATPEPTMTPMPTDTPEATATNWSPTATPAMVASTSQPRSSVGGDLLVVVAGAAVLIGAGLLAIRMLKPKKPRVEVFGPDENERWDS